MLQWKLCHLCIWGDGSYPTDRGLSDRLYLSHLSYFSSLSHLSYLSDGSTDPTYRIDPDQPRLSFSKFIFSSKIHVIPKPSCGPKHLKSCKAGPLVPKLSSGPSDHIRLIGAYRTYRTYLHCPTDCTYRTYRIDRTYPTYPNQPRLPLSKFISPFQIPASRKPSCRPKRLKSS
jgi:hypothetical protein